MLRLATQRPQWRALLALLATIIAPILLAPEVRAQAGAAGPIGAPFHWAESPAPGYVRYSDVVDGFGWVELGTGVSARVVPSYSSDPTLEIVLDAPLSGHPTLPEVFLLQIPREFNQLPLNQRRLVVAFHPFGVSHKSPFNGSRLPEECDRRGLMLLSPFGLSQTHFGNVASQESLDAVLALLHQTLPFDPEQVYTAGFSMGGTSALSYAMRHQDPEGLRIAGVICHTGTIDVIDDYETGDAFLQPVIEDALGGSPTDQPFAYERINPGRLSSPTAYFADQVAVWNLIDVPIYFHLNVSDPNLDLLQHNLALHDFLSTRGFNVTLDLADTAQGLPKNCIGIVGSSPSVHSWCTLVAANALDFVEGAVAPGPVPQSASVIEIYADREDRYRFTEVLELDDDVVGRFRVSFPKGGSNLLGVHSIRGVRELALDFETTGLNAGQPASITTWSNDVKATTLILRGYPSAPSLVLVNGGQPVSWSYDAGSNNLTVQATSNGAFGLIEILP
ncbi:MAG: hypothetical protein AAFZ65_04520 [Planctomycetota bacterium]